MKDAPQTIDEIGSDSILFAHKAYRLLENQQAHKALELCEAGVKRFPFYAEGHFILGKCYQSLKKLEEAKDEYERTLVYMPGHLRALNALAFIFHRKNLVAKANELLIQSLMHNPLNPDLVEYLKSENIYKDIYSKPQFIKRITPSDSELGFQEKDKIPDLAQDLEEKIAEEAVKEKDEDSSLDTKVDLRTWEIEADQIRPEDLLPFAFSEKDIEDSTIQFGDSRVIDFEKDRDSDLGLPEVDKELFLEYEIDSESKISTAETIGDKKDKVVWAADEEKEIEIEPTTEQKIIIDKETKDETLFGESELDPSLLADDSLEDFFLSPEDTRISESKPEAEETKIDLFAASKDEITELSIDQYEVNNIIDNIIEADKLNSAKPDLSKFANIDEDFSTLMDGIFEKKSDREEEEEKQDSEIIAEGLELEDEAEVAEERPILDTAVIFMDKKRSDLEQTEKSRSESEISESVSKLEDKDEIKLSDVKSTRREDEITKVIDKIEKADRSSLHKQRKGSFTDSDYQENQLESAYKLEDENVSIDEILANPKMLTPTFGEILIAQKKFEDARRVFMELFRKDPSNIHLKRKIDFLNKLVEFHK